MIDIQPGVGQMNKNRSMLVAAACGVLLLWDNAFAYIDPGTGSLLIQWLFGAVIAGFAVVNLYWERFKFFLARRFGSEGIDLDVVHAEDEAGSDR